MHEQSQTIEQDGKYYNVSGVTGETLEGPFKSTDEAVTSAKKRSESFSTGYEIEIDKAIQELTDKGLIQPEKTEEGWKVRIGQAVKEGFTSPTAIGAMTGMAVGGTIGGPPGAVLGAAIGGAGGFLASRAGEFLATGKELPSAEEVGMVGAESAVTQGVAELTLGTGRFVRAPGGKGALKELPTLEASQRFGVSLTPAQITEKGSVSAFFEGVARGGVFSKGMFETAKEAAVKEQIPKATEQVSNIIASKQIPGLNPFLRGQLLKDALEQGSETHKGIAKGLYDNAFNMIQTQTTNLPRSLRVVVGEIENSTTKVPEMSKVLRKLKNAYTPGKNQNQGMITFNDLRDIRSTLFDIQAKLEQEPGSSNAKRLVGKLTGEVNQAIKSKIAQEGSQTQKAFEYADQFYRIGKKQFNTDIIKKIVKDKTSAENVGRILFVENNSTNILKVKQALKAAQGYTKGDVNAEQIWDTMKAGWFRGLIDEATNTTTGIVNAQQVINKLDSPGMRETLRLMFQNKDHLQTVKDFFGIVRKATLQRPAPAGQMFIQLTQGGSLLFSVPAALTVGNAPVLAGGATIAIGPMALGKLFTKVTTAERLLRIAKVKPGHKFATQLAVSDMTFIVKELQKSDPNMEDYRVLMPKTSSSQSSPATPKPSVSEQETKWAQEHIEEIGLGPGGVANITRKAILKEIVQQTNKAPMETLRRIAKDISMEESKTAGGFERFKPKAKKKVRGLKVFSEEEQSFEKLQKGKKR